jgi:heme-degrading monooxygenase HmoA
MIMRVWTTAVVVGREADYLKFAQERSALMFLSQPGCLGVLFLKGVDEKHAVCSFWKSDADIALLEISSTYRSTVSDLLSTGILAGEATVQLYDVEGGVLQSFDFSTALERKKSKSRLR